jgi:hypothetical protein
VSASARPARLLFVGNSYTARNDLPQLIVRLAAEAASPLVVETRMVIAGGASLRRHWNAPHAREAIAAERWDWVVLQEQSTLPVKNASRYHDNVRLFQAPISAAGARMALYQTWARRDAPQAQDTIDAAVTAIARECAARAVRVGPAWREALRRDASLPLYTDDGSHPSPLGSYLAACVFLRALLGRSPGGFAVADRLAIPHHRAALMHEVAAAEGGAPVEPH